jgi:hypothetical protein
MARTLTAEQRANLERARDTLRARLDSGERFESADAYYGCRDALRETEAELRGVSAHVVDPTGFWFGRQSA